MEEREVVKGGREKGGGTEIAASVLLMECFCECLEASGGGWARGARLTAPQLRGEVRGRSTARGGGSVILTPCLFISV